MDHSAHGRHRPRRGDTRMRSSTVIALTSAAVAATPAAVMTGSAPLALLIAGGTVAGVGLAGVMI
ncbi:hypothetical protein ACFWPA_03490 [Rhodococcus sp. NPDC058505]|uniref:hypothetical protein n=1 Tax=unclassified Rhodococcus (in: high G+C Gram-positive bacteria) TaxID=192944 RepID=UPI00364B407B